MTARRRLPAAAAALLSLAALTACEKPAPIVTLVNAGQSVYAQANVFCFEGQSDAAGECATRTEGSTTLAVEGGQPVGIDVAKDLVERTWFIELSDPAKPEDTETQRSQVQDEHYLSFTAPNLPEGSSVLLTVRTLGAGSSGPTGEWRFTLVPR